MKYSNLGLGAFLDISEKNEVKVHSMGSVQPSKLSLTPASSPLNVTSSFETHALER